MNTSAKPIPEGLDLITEMSGVTIRRSWFSHAVWFMLFFAIAWDSFLIFWYTVAVRADGANWIAIVFPIGHIAVGVGITYHVLCQFLNKTDFSIAADTLTIRTHPLPRFGNKRIDTKDIDGVKVRRRDGGENSSTYDVSYVSSQNKEIKLLKGLRDFEVADYYASTVASLLSMKKEEDATQASEATSYSREG